MLSANGAGLTGPPGCTVITVTSNQIGVGATPSVSGIYCAPLDGSGRGLVYVVGEYQIGGNLVGAALWTCPLYDNTTTPTVTSLALPITTYQQSAAISTNSTTQVGYAQLQNGGAYHAIVWSGTAASFVDLHVSPWLSSYLIGISAVGVKCGYVLLVNEVNNTVTRAALWTNNNVSSLLPLPDTTIWSEGPTDSISTWATGNL